MTSWKPNPILRFYPSLRDLAFLLPVIFVFFRSKGAERMLEGDTGWHLRTGEWILANGRVPTVDFFSFTKSGEPWFAWEWLWDLLFAWLHAIGGLTAAVLVSVLVLCTTFGLLYTLALRLSGNEFLSIGVTALACAGSVFHWTARPHLFTLLFTVAFLHILERTRNGQSRLLWMLPLLMVLWTNIHGGFLTGLILLGAYFAGYLLKGLFEVDPVERRRLWKSSLPYAVCLAVCTGATFLNPYFAKLHVHIFAMLTDEKSPFRYVDEWSSFDYYSPLAIYLEGMMILALGAAVWHVSQRRFTYVLLVLVWFHYGHLASRHVPIFLVIAAPGVALALAKMIEAAKTARLPGWIRRGAAGFQNIAGEFRGMENVPRLHLVTLAVLLGVFVLSYSPDASERFRADFNAKNYPTEAVAKIEEMGITGNFLSTDEWSDYLIYRLYPDVQVYFDGRFDFYGFDFTKEYTTLASAGRGWENELSRHSLKAILLPKDGPLAMGLKKSRDWTMIHEDGVATLFSPAFSPRGTGKESSIAAGNEQDPACEPGFDSVSGERNGPEHFNQRGDTDNG